MREVSQKEYIDYIEQLGYVTHKIENGNGKWFVDDLLVAFRETENNFYILK